MAWLALFLLCFLWLSLPLSAQEQPERPPGYWRHSASRRINHLLAEDMNQDGVAEFLVTAENGRVDLLSSDGLLQWSYPAGDVVQAITTITIYENNRQQQATVLAANNQLTFLGQDGKMRWQKRLAPTPLPTFVPFGQDDLDITTLSQVDSSIHQIKAFDANRDGIDEILVMHTSGQLRLYDIHGNQVHENLETIGAADDVPPTLQVGDLNGDGYEEIVIGFFNGRYSEIVLLDGALNSLGGQAQPVSGHITAMELVPLAQNGALHIAVGTAQGEVRLYDYAQQRLWWPRTLNKPITALTMADLVAGPALIVGTEVGAVVAYAPNGQRIWERRLAPDANRSIVSLSAAPVAEENNPSIAAVLSPINGASGPNDVQLLSGNGRSLTLFEAADSAGLSQLLDSNGDGRGELLLGRFATAELLGLGLGASEMANERDFSLDAEPSSTLIVDFDKDGHEELLVGAKDGFLRHRIDRNTWGFAVSPGGTITHLAMLERENGQENIVVISNSTLLGPNNEETYQSWIEVRQVNGDRIWEEPLTIPITSLLVENVNSGNEAEIIVGTRNGQLLAFTANGNLLWQERINEPESPIEPIERLLLVQNQVTDQPEIIAATNNHLFSVSIPPTDNTPTAIATYSAGIQNIFPLNQPGNELGLRMLAFLGEEARGLTWRGIQLPPWPLSLEDRIRVSIPANDITDDNFEDNMAESFLVATESTLLRLAVNSNRPDILRRISGLNNVTSLYWGDMDGDALAEIVVGNSEESQGHIWLFSDQFQLVDEIQLSSGVHSIEALKRPGNQRDELLVITENGEVQILRTQENRPPLLTNPTAEALAGQYSFSVSVMDTEGDEVLVQLEIFNPETDAWEIQGAEVLPNGSDRRFWPVVNPATAADGVRYRFFYDDGSYTGTMTPPPGPIPVANTNLLASNPALLGILGVIGVTAVLLLVRQTQLPAFRARRFYRTLKNKPEKTLVLLEEKYSQTHGSLDFLLYLASLARQRGDNLVSNLADGLFLLTDRPHVGVSIITTALEEVSNQTPSWKSLTRWQMIFKTGQALLEAPTLTELSLLRPQLAQLLETLEAQSQWSPLLDALLPILTNLRDSERVELPEDRFAYLNEAAHLLSTLQGRLPDFPVRIEKTLVAAIARRWRGLVSAANEELRGRADLSITLKTKRIVPAEQTLITVELANNGRAAAENVAAVLDEDPAYVIHSQAPVIPLLPPGRYRRVNFTITPQVPDRFRMSMTVTFTDRNRRDKTIAFGDRVHLLPPVRDFKPVSNPYLPGTPLRRRSNIFYGREQLFSFIADNAGGWSQRNVLILIGQRRTGKTSALLRLEQHLPDHLLPIYIDCQSLGVVPGMPALFHDIAWLIADALARRDLALDVPPPEAWQADPTGQFQRHFLPQAKSLLPEGSVLLLLFDEFEAFENLVEDGILPPTFFSFMRHLMQHSRGMSFIFVGTRRLEEMSADYWSVLFNIALYERITYLDETAAARLITEPVAPNLVYDDLALDKILRVTAGHPYFLQLVCYALVKQANARKTGYVTISDVNAALDDMLSLGEVHFAYLWRRSSYTEQALLTAVAHMMDSDLAYHPEDLLEFLGSYGIHLNPKEVTVAFNRLVEREIMREVAEGGHTLYELKLGLVGLWTAKHKSLSKLHAAHTNGAPQPQKQLPRL